MARPKPISRNCMNCGKGILIRPYQIRRGRGRYCSRKCWLTGPEVFGDEYKSEWRAWCNMRERCLRPTNTAYEHYGGRGITICPRWQESFSNFIEDLGKKPSPKHSLDRIDNDGNYKPSNCKWATCIEQMNNTRRNLHARG